MNELLAHRWGLNTAQDRIWAHVTGLAPRFAVRRLLMVLQFQAFMDESVSKEEFVLAGYIAPAEIWAKFSKDWDELLPLAVQTRDGHFHFKMSEMAARGSMDRVRAFYNIIDKYDELIPVSFRMNLVEFKNAQERMVEFARVMNWELDYQAWTNPYFFSFRTFLNQFHTNAGPVSEAIPSGETVDFIFDDRTEKRFILSAWDEIVEKLAHYSEIQLPFGSSPRFEDDQKFLPLQAADLWAWWVREWYEEDSNPVPDKINTLDFGLWRGKRRRKLIMVIEEDGIFNTLKAMAVENIAEGNVDPLTAARNRGEL
jgi:Protein of unknown function (DUF3800)